MGDELRTQECARGVNYRSAAGVGLFFLVQASQASAQAVCVDHNQPGDPVNTVPCVVPEGTTLGRVETTGNGSTIEVLGAVTGGVFTDGDNAGVTNTGSGGFFIATTGANSDIVNTSDTFVFRFPDLLTFGPGSDVFNSGSAATVEVRGNGSTLENSGIIANVTFGARDGVLKNTGTIAGNSFNAINFGGTNVRFINEGTAGFTVISGDDITLVNSGTMSEIISIPLGRNLQIENSGTITGDLELENEETRIQNTGMINGLVQVEGNDLELINSGTIGGSVSAQGDTARISNSGQVMDQIEIRGMTSQIMNSGSAESILVSSTATGSDIQNSGAIAEDIFVEATGVSVANSGTVGGAIIATAGNAAINNSGTAAALVAEGAASTLFNSGTVAGLVRADGNGASFTNTGRAGSFVGAGDNSVIDNSGRIDLIGTSGDNVRVVNSGRIGSGGADDGIEFLGANAFLELREGTLIEGDISFQGSGTQTLEIGDLGELNYTFSNAPNRIIANGANFVLSGNQLSVFNSTALSTQDEQLFDLTRGISSVLEDRFQTLRRDNFVPSRARPAFAFSQTDSEQSVWLDAFGSYRDQDADGQIAENTQWVGGLIVGADPVVVGPVEAGFFVGASRGGVDADDVSQSVDSQSYFLGTYATAQHGATLFDLALTLGYSDFDQERQAASNIASGGRETITADFDGWFVSPSVTITRPAEIAGQRVEGSLGLRYAGLFLDSYTESGTTAPQTIDSRDVHVGVARLQVALPREKVTSDGSLLSYRVQAGLEARTNFGGDTVDGVLLGQNISFNTGDDIDTLGGYLSLSGEYQTQNGLIVSAGTEAIYESSGSYQFSARAGLEFRF